MAEVKEQNSSEPTMEEILASIRKIISDDGTANPPTPAVVPKMVSVPINDITTDEIVELTQVIKEDGSVVEANTLPPLESIKMEEPLKLEEPAKVDLAPPPVAEKLVSDLVVKETAQSLTTLANTVESGNQAAGLHLGDTSKTIEHLVLELLRPHLREWLDQNLHSIVERLVQKEIDRISRKAHD